MSADLSHLVDIVEAFPRQTVVLYGDLVADEYVFGEISRVSREAPVLILRHRETQLVPGGGANAANNLIDLDYFRRKKADTSGILRVRGWTTTTKTRFLAGWTHTTRQQVLRVDREPSAVLPAKVRAALLRTARERAPGRG